MRTPGGAYNERNNLLIHNRKMRRTGKETIPLGLGPFTPASLFSFTNRLCQKCGKSIPEQTLFGNSISISSGTIEFLCIKCRTGVDNKLYSDHPVNVAEPKSETNNTIDRLVIIGEIDHLIKEGNLNFTYYDVILCLRQGFGHFQKFNRKPFSGFSKFILNEATHRFGRPLPGSCAECGALWANEWELSLKNVDAILKHRNYSSTQCWSCGFLHSNQWFLSTTYEKEHSLLFNLT